VFAALFVGLAGWLSAAQYVYFFPSSNEAAIAMLELAGVGPNDVVYDLGSGDGRIVLLAAEKFGARGVGIEQDLALVEQSRHAAAERRLSSTVMFRHEDFFTADISDATVVTLFLTPSLNTMLEPRLRQLRPGTRIVSNQFPIGNWVPDRSARSAAGEDVFLWTVPRLPARTPDVYFATTQQAVALAMLRLAGTTTGDVVYDLGSGDGRIVILAAQRFGARGVGVEIDPPLVERSRQVAREAAVDDQVTFIEGDLFTADISAATVVTLFLSPGTNRALEQKLRTELKPGTRIVSHQFPIATWTPDKTVRAADGTDVYLWIVPPPVPQERR
jgi:predicted RNA methylase